MVVEEFHDQKIIYHLNIDEEVNNILMHLSSLKTIKTNRVIKGTTLVGAFYIFSLAFYSYLFHILFILQRGRKSSMISPTLRLKEKCMRAIFQPRLKSTERYGMKR